MVRGKERGGGDRQENERDKKREEIALKAVDLSELNHRRPAVHSDSALPLNITDTEMGRYSQNNSQIVGIKEASRH